MACCLGTTAEPVLRPDFDYERPLVRMCAPGNQAGFPNFVDIGDTVVLFVDFGDNFQPMEKTADHPMGGATAGNAWPEQRHQAGTELYEVKLAGLQAFLKRIQPKDRHCKSFKTEAKILMTDEILDNPGELVKFKVPYCNNRGKYLGEVTEKDITEENHKVYCHALWNELIGYNKDVRDEIHDRTSSKLGDTSYGSIRRTNRSSLYTDKQDGVGTSSSVHQLASEEHAPLQVNGQPRPKRLWPDSWEMSCWRKCCDPCLRANNCFTRFWAMFFVTPLTNVTGLSLYYQLYLSEIFHTRFWTRLGHYLCMPLIVMMMLSFFAQWRFYGCYSLVNTEVLVFNGSLVLSALLILWYIVWGMVQETYLMGFFMMVPMAVLYVLANIIFQLSVKNSPVKIYACNACWNHTVYFNGAVQYYSSFKLMPWYFNPLLWICVLCFGQALSHIFEPTIPPRVNQTAHWLSCGDMLKRHGCARSFMILCAQAVFGTIDELLASPRLLPLFILRICFTLGYQPKEWEVLKLLVKKSIEFGNPALDYIGTGGALYLPEDSLIPEDSVRSIKDLEHTAQPSPQNGGSLGVFIGKLRSQLCELKLTLTQEQKAILQEPSLLRGYQAIHPALEQYIVLRHYVAKYELQLHAYGPFRTTRDEKEVLLDNRRMERDFSSQRHGSFQNFLKQVRFYLWMMEDDMIERRAVSACCDEEL